MIKDQPLKLHQKLQQMTFSILILAFKKQTKILDILCKMPVKCHKTYNKKQHFKLIDLINHVNRLPADDSHVLSSLIYPQNKQDIFQVLSSASIVI